MNKCKDIIKARREFIRKKVNQAPSVTKEVTRLSKTLFLSESTIYKDLQIKCKDGNTPPQNGEKAA